MRTTGISGDHVLAWTAVALFHAVLFVLLLQLRPPLPERTAGDSTLEVLWIAAPRRSPQPVRAPVAPARPSRPRAGAVPRPPGAPALAADAPDDAVAPATPPSVVFAEQVRLPEPAFPAARDPFANRSVRLPGRDARTFRMRPPPSLADRMAGVARAFGGGDDPCRSNRDSIDALSQAGDSRALQHALAYERRHCR